MSFFSLLQDLRFALRQLRRAPALCVDGRIHARAGHRRQHGDLLAAGSGAFFDLSPFTIRPGS